MCTTIAPDCAEYAYGYSGGSVTTNIYDSLDKNESDRHIKLPTDGPNLKTLNTGEDRRHDHIGRRRFFHERNRSESLWESATRDLTTESSIQSGANFIGVTGQYPAMTDSGLFSYSLYSAAN